MVKQNKRLIAMKARFVVTLLIGLFAILGVVTTKADSIDPWIKLSIQFLFCVYCGAQGYIMGWDANKKPSTLKGP